MRAANGSPSGRAESVFACDIGCPGGDAEAPKPPAPPMRAAMSCRCCSSDQIDGSGAEGKGELLDCRDMDGGVICGVSSPRNCLTLDGGGGMAAKGGSMAVCRVKCSVQAHTCL